MEEQALSILRDHGLSVTTVRKGILDVFLKTGQALSHSDLEGQASGQLDRVTVYRTLQAFVGKGIIHVIPTSDNSLRYALCRDACVDGHHHDRHVHFICHHCGKATCINQLDVPSVRLPRGYRMKEVSMVVHGVCPNCD